MKVSALKLSDYETYWSDREKGEEEAVQEEPDETIIETYKVNGEVVEVEINGAWAKFRYDNGTDNTVPLSDLYLCPKCMKEGAFPFCFDVNMCPEHEHDLIKFERSGYDSFKLAAQMTGTLVPQ